MAALVSGLQSAHVLSAVQWLDTTAVHLHERAGIRPLIVLIVLAILSGTILERSRGGRKVGFVRLRTAILVLATLSFGMVLWTSQLGRRTPTQRA